MAPIGTGVLDFPVRRLRTRNTKSKANDIDELKLEKTIARSPLKQVKSPKPSPLKSKLSTTTGNSRLGTSRSTTPYKVALHFSDGNNQENKSPNVKNTTVKNLSPEKPERYSPAASPTKLKVRSTSKNASPLKNSNQLTSPVKKVLPSLLKLLQTNNQTKLDRILRSPCKESLSIGSPIKRGLKSPRKLILEQTESERSLRSPSKQSLSIGSPLKRGLKSPRKLLLDNAESDRILRSPCKSSLPICSEKKENEGKDENKPNECTLKRSPRKIVRIGESSLFRADVSHLVEARRALSTALPPNSAGLIGRQKQLDLLQEFLRRNLVETGKKIAKGKRSIYISGPPGTGKTTCLKHLINILTSDKDSKDKVDTRLRVPEEPHCIFVNCMALKNTSSVYSTIANQILPIVGSLDIGSSPESHKKALESVIVGKNTEKKILLVLDEMDQLDSKFHEVLYSLFEWPYLRNSKLVLVGIANSLDLTDRILPRLKVSIVPPHLS